MTDRFEAARAVADALLYEGYVLYPYRASAPKNRVRFPFGVLVPPEDAAADAVERSSARTECVMVAGAAPVLRVLVRCLQAQQRTVERLDGSGRRTPVEMLDVDGTRWVSWDEATEHEIALGPVPVLPAGEVSREIAFELPAWSEEEPLHDSSGAVRGYVLRRRERVTGAVRLDAVEVAGARRFVRLAVTVANTSAGPAATSRTDATRRSLLAVHTLLAADDGELLSALDPPPDAVSATRQCASDGTHPVLVDRQLVLSSPIIVYDFPAVASQSAGDMFDATEIDEILALRVLTLTDDEKAEARATDPRAAAIVDRCDALDDDAWIRMHGTMRAIATAGGADAQVPWWSPAAEAGVDPATDRAWVGGIPVAAGAKVRLRPTRRADAHDLFLAGMVATVAGVYHDVDGGEHVAVTIDDDPATELLAWQRRYLYFHPDELEVLR